MDEALDDWFAREILPHEAALTRYIGRASSNHADIQDLRQEIYIKVMEAAEKSRPLTPRFFLFYLARNVLADHARRNRIVPIDLLQDRDVSNDLIDEVSPERRAGSFQQLVKLVSAFEQLPDRCREVLWLKKIDDLSQREIAERLHLAEGTIEAHLVRGMRQLTKLFYSEASEGSEAEHRKSEHGSRNGR